MKALLTEKGNTMADVEKLMNWPVLTRDPDGWLPSEVVPLNLGEQAFSRVEGIRFDLDTGEIQLMLASPVKDSDALFNMEDVADVLKKGIPGASFTLDQPDPSLPDHPFQEMKYVPKSLKGTNYLGTLLHADLLLKYLSMKTVTSGKAPFALQDAEESILKCLPEDLREELKELNEKMASSGAKAHRFWIEAGQLLFSEKQEKNAIIFTFGECEMAVKKHLMRYDRNGKLVDADEDNNTDSPEAKFARFITKNYPRLVKCFPILERLQELTKINALSNLSKGVYDSMKASAKSFTIPLEKLDEILTDLNKQISYPQATDSNVENILNQVLKANNTSRYSVSSWELERVKNKIREQCAKADEDTVKQITNLLAKEFNVYLTSILEGYVVDWLSRGQTSYLKQLLKDSGEAYQRKKFTLICETFQKHGFATAFDNSINEAHCTWVPAAFSYDPKTHRKIYGGVNMNPNLVQTSNLNPPNGGGPIGSGVSGTGYRHIVRMDAGGRIYGTTTCVDSVTGNTYKAVEIQSSIRDQWNQNRPDIAAFWQTHVGYTDVHHYTRHQTGGTHIHNVSGVTTCINQKGNMTTYRPADHNHNCNK